MQVQLPARPIGALCIVTLLAACDATGNDRGVAVSEAPTTAEPSAQGPREALPGPQGENAVGARIYEYEIEITRDTAEAGEIEFHVVNAGTTEHWLIVRGEDEFFATPHLMPGEAAILRVTLEPGEYQLVCTIRDEFDHISEGERRDFVVR